MVCHHPPLPGRYEDCVEVSVTWSVTSYRWMWCSHRWTCDLSVCIHVSSTLSRLYKSDISSLEVFLNTLHTNTGGCTGIRVFPEHPRNTLYTESPESRCRLQSFFAMGIPFHVSMYMVPSFIVLPSFLIRVTNLNRRLHTPQPV